MAELNYDDVRRAAQEAMRDLQNVVYGLQNSHNDLRRIVQQNSNTNAQYQLGDIVSRLGNLQQQISAITNAMRNPPTGQPHPVHLSIQQSVAELHRRLSSIEQFVQVCYRYFEAQQQQQNEEQGFRGA